MISYWQHIKNKIESEFGVNHPTDWCVRGNEKLKKLEAKLERTVKDKIANDIFIAKQFLKNSVVSDFVDSGERRALIEKYVLSGDLENPKIDVRTLENFIIEGIIPTQKRIKNIYSIYVFNQPFTVASSEFEMKNNLSEDEPSEPSNSLKINNFHNTTWWAYYFHYNESQKLGLLGRAILEIKKDGDAYLKNIEHETSTDYNGKIHLEISNQHLIINLWSEGTKEKHLRINVFVGMGKVYPLLIGIYTNIYSNNSTVAGTIILEKTKNDITQLEMPKTFNFQEAQGVGINKLIVEFLQNREQNFIKAPSGILTAEMLERWLIKKKKDKT